MHCCSPSKKNTKKLKSWLTLLFLSGTRVNCLPLFIQKPPLILLLDGFLAGSEDPWYFRGDVFPTASSVLRSRDYDSLGGELRHTDGCPHVMHAFILVSNKGDVWINQSTQFGLMVNLFWRWDAVKTGVTVCTVDLWLSKSISYSVLHHLFVFEVIGLLLLIQAICVFGLCYW